MAAGGGGGATGIRGTITANSALNTVSLERDSVVIQQFGPGALTYTFEDVLPLDGVTYTYNTFETRTGYVQSVDSGTAAGKPTTLGGLAP